MVIDIQTGETDIYIRIMTQQFVECVGVTCKDFSGFIWLAHLPGKQRVLGSLTRGTKYPKWASLSVLVAETQTVNFFPLCDK